MKDKKFDTLEKTHLVGFKGLWKIYGGLRFLIKTSFIVAFITSILILIVVNTGVVKVDSLFDVIKELSEVGLSLEGGLIGLTLAGLTLIVTFGSDNLMKRIVKNRIKTDLKEKNGVGLSGYQTAVSKFTFAVFVQIFTLIVLFLGKFFIGLKLSFDDNYWNHIINKTYLFIEILLILYSLFLLLQMTLNIFTMSQMNHSVMYNDVSKEVLDEMKSAKGTDSNSGNKDGKPEV